MSRPYDATKESVSRNALALAREAAKRWNIHKKLAKKFVAEFKSVNSVDQKYGRKKYKALLQQAANYNRETIFIDLNDVGTFLDQEKANPDPDFLEDEPGAGKANLQESIELMVKDIEHNTMDYAKYFYQACAAELPERDDGFNQENRSLAREHVQKWRERKLREEADVQNPGAEGRNAENLGSRIPAQLKNPFEIRFKPRSSWHDGKAMKLRDIDSRVVGALVQFDCLVVRVSNVKPKVEVVTYSCQACGAEIFQSVESERYTPVLECPSQRCIDNKKGGKLRQTVRTCKFVKYQEMKVQEMAEHVPEGGVPRSINVVVGGDLCRTACPGNTITLTGVFTPTSQPWFIARKRGATLNDMYIEAHHIQKHKSGYNEENNDEKEVLARVDHEQERLGTLYETASKSIAPEIFGHADVKKALLLVLIGSFTKVMEDGMKIRGDIHTLFMGDPGVAKSQLLKQVCKIAPRSIYTTGRGSSGAGLTAAVLRDPLTGEVALEAGALVLADTGVCCIDEFDKMDENDRTAIHEVMEQQSVSMAKAGITTTLNCRTTIMAAANPQFGRYDPRKSPVENINLPPALLSRFDFLFLLLDTVEAEKDKMLAGHVAKVWARYDRPADAQEDMAEGPEAGQEGEAAAAAAAPEDADPLGLGFKPYDANFMRAYIRKARSYEPLIDDALQRDIADAYVSIRDDEKRDAASDSRKAYTTPRTLLAILRISQAHARARFSDRVERQDFDEAMRLMKVSKESIELSAPAKKGQNPIDVIYDIVADLSKSSKDADGWVDMAHVVNMAGNKAFNQEMVTEAIENWESLSVMIRNDAKTKVRFLIPDA